MSLFGSFLGDVDDDPFFGGHMRQMNRMMNSFFSQPFGGMLGPGIGSELMPFNRQPMGGAMMPFGFPNMGHMFGELGNNPSCHSFSSSTVMTMNTGPDGRPQVYQASSSVRQGPGGIKETKKSVSDSQSGVKKLSIGHHIGERAHIIEREQNVRTGDREERQEYINIEEDDADGFNQEWVQRTRHVTPGARRALTAPDRYSHHGTGRRLPALPAPSSSPHENCSPSTTPSPKSRKRQHQADSDDSSSDEHQPKSTKTSSD